MKKFLSILSIIIMCMIMGITPVNASEDTYTLEFKIKEAKEEFDLYILLPKEYVEYALKESGLDVTYKGPITLKENEVLGIRTKKENIMDEPYQENNKEYVQILLEKNKDEKYEFDILSGYEKMDMKYRVKNMKKDYILHIDNFKAKGGFCKIEYNYETDELKQPSEIVIPFATKLLLIILVIIVAVGLIAYIKQRR